VILIATLTATLFAAPPAPAAVPSLAGGWTLNKDASDQPPDRADRDQGDQRGGSGGGSGGYGGRRGGGFGGRRGGGGFGRGGGGGSMMDPADAARMREAMRDIMTAPDHLVVTQTDSMVVFTSADGRTTRLAPDGKKVKDDSTKIERKTKWDGDKLVTEISGIGRGKVTETYALDAEHHQLRRTLVMEGRGGQPRTTTFVYDIDRDER